MRARWAGALTAVLMLMFVGTTAAAAISPVALGAGYVLDDAGAMSSSQLASSEQRLGELYESTGVDLYAVFVDEFTDPTSSQEWADAVAEQNGLGPTQYLLAVATDGRQFYISGDSSGPMSDEQLTAVESAIKPQLSSGDYAGAVSTAADGFESALNGGSSVAGGFPVGLVVFIVIAAIVALIIWLFMRRRRKAGVSTAAGGTPAVPQIDVEELARQASSALVETDDAVRTSEQELGFARAQFGDAATAEFETALATAREKLNQAFTLKQQLDDSVPDTGEQTRTWNDEILRLCAQANAGLDEKAADFDELRKLEQNAPESLARVQGQRAQAAADIDAAAASLQTLGSRYAPAALATVADNPEQARQRIAFADEQLTAAEAAIAAGEHGQAAVSIRAAEESVGQAALLEAAIDKLGGDLAEGEKSAEALIAELEGDIAAASALPDAQGAVAAAIAVARQQVDAARTNLTGSARRPLLTLQSLEAANAQIDAVSAGVRDAAAQADRARQLLGQQMMQAQAQVSTAEDYITSRRGAVGATARTRLAEAGAALVQAQQLQASNPEQALQYAQRAGQLAGQASQLAQSDVGGFQNGGMGGLFGGGSTNSGGSGGGMLGAVLGGIVINSMLGGGRSGGSSSGGIIFGGGGGRSGGGGRISPGSFGGGGTRGRRGGGRF